MEDILDIKHVIRSPIVTGIHTLNLRKADKFRKYGKYSNFPETATDNHNGFIFSSTTQIKTHPNFEYIDSFYNLGMFNIETNDTLDELLLMEERDDGYSKEGKNSEEEKPRENCDSDEQTGALRLDFFEGLELQSVTVLVKKNSISINDHQYSFGDANILSSCVLKGIPVSFGDGTSLLENEDSLILSLSDEKLIILKFFYDGEKFLPFIFQWMKYDCHSISAHISGLFFVVYKHNSSFISIFKCQNDARCATMIQGLNIFKNDNGNECDPIIIYCDFIKIQDMFTLFIVYYAKNKIQIRTVDWFSELNSFASGGDAAKSNIITGDVNPISFNNVSLLPLIDLKEPPIFVIPVNGSHNFIMIYEKFIKVISSNDIISGIFDIPSVDTTFDSFPLNYYQDDNYGCIYVSTAGGNLYCISFMDKESFETSKNIQISEMGEFKNIKLSVFQLEKLPNNDIFELIYFDESSVGFNGKVRLNNKESPNNIVTKNFEIVETYETFQNWSPIVDFGIVNDSLWLLNNKGYLIQINYGFEMKTNSRILLVDTDANINGAELSFVIPYNFEKLGNYIIVERVDKQSEIIRTCYSLEDFGAGKFNLLETILLNVDLQNRSLLLDTVNNEWIIQVTTDYLKVSNASRLFDETFENNDKCYMSCCFNEYIICITKSMKLRLYKFENGKLNSSNIQLEKTVTKLRMFQTRKIKSVKYALLGFAEGFFEIIDLEDFRTVKIFQLNDFKFDQLVHNIEVLETEFGIVELLISDYSGNFYILTLRNNSSFDIINLQRFQLNEIKIDIIKLNSEEIFLKSLNFYKLIPKEFDENKMITNYCFLKVYNLPRSASSIIKISQYNERNFLLLDNKGQFYVTSMKKNGCNVPDPISKHFFTGNAKAFRMIHLPHYSGIVTLCKDREEAELSFFDVKYAKIQPICFQGYKVDKKFKNIPTCISEWTISNEKSKYRNLIIGYIRVERANGETDDSNHSGVLKVFEIKRKSSDQKSNKEIIFNCLYSWNVLHPVSCVIQIIELNCVLYAYGCSLCLRAYDISEKKLENEKTILNMKDMIMDVHYDKTTNRIFVSTANNYYISKPLMFEDERSLLLGYIYNNTVDRSITNAILYSNIKNEYQYKLEDDENEMQHEIFNLYSSDSQIKDYCLFFDKFNNSLVLKDKIHEYSKKIQGIGKLKMNAKNVMNGEGHNNLTNQKLFGNEYDFIFCSIGGDIILIKNRT